MIRTISLLMCLLGSFDGVETRFEQVFPVPKIKDMADRSLGQHRAVLLIPGLRVHSFSNAKVHQAHFHDWQAPNSHLVQALGKHADVFIFAYAQNVPVETIAQHPALANSVQRLRVLGYDDIILIGHSAGGIVARLFVEDNPQAGVTRVVQVSAPNLGSSWAKADITVRKDQEVFLRSLTKEERQRTTRLRQDKKIPANVEFVCVVGSTGNLGDGLVSVQSQWPEDLQAQGIPAVRLGTNHFFVVRSAANAARIAGLAIQYHPRWSEEERAVRRKQVLAP